MAAVSSLREARRRGMGSTSERGRCSPGNGTASLKG
jgi:hypothetical protein